MSGNVPVDPGQPPEKKGLSNGAIVMIAIVALVLILFGVCVVGGLTSGA